MPSIRENVWKTPKNKEFDLKPGDYITAEILQAELPGKDNYRSETLKVTKVYPHMTECVRANGAHYYISNSQYICGLVKKATAAEKAEFDKRERRRKEQEK